MYYSSPSEEFVDPLNSLSLPPETVPMLSVVQVINDEPLFSSKKRVSPGYPERISVTLLQFTSNIAFKVHRKMLGHPYSTCVKNDSNFLTYFPVYTEDRCLHECLANVVVGVCNCLPQD